MAYETRDNSGRLFKNEDKKSDKHPDYSGDALIDGQAYFMDAWLKTVDPVRPDPMTEPIPVPEATESDFAAFEELTGRKA